MALEGLSSRLQDITRKLRGKARITESDLKEVLREVKLALLEADVNYKIVKDFIKVIEEKALGQDVLKSLTPGQQVVKIVKDELVTLLGGEESRINFSPNPPTVIMLVGLQGSGKTTTAGKLANIIRKQGTKCCGGCAAKSLCRGAGCRRPRPGRRRRSCRLQDFCVSHHQFLQRISASWVPGSTSRFWEMGRSYTSTTHRSIEIS